MLLLFMDIKVLKVCCDCGDPFMLTNFQTIAAAELAAKADMLCEECVITKKMVPAFIKLALQLQPSGEQSFPA